ncbi:unnamed protein product [Brassica oleracea]
MRSINTSSDDCSASIKSNSHQVLGYGRDRKVILEAPLYDKDCVLGNNLAAHYLFSSDISRAKTYARAAEYHLLCHVLQTECRFKEAVEFMEACSASWDSCSSLRTCNMNKKKQQLMQKAIQLAEAVYEYGKGNNTKALEMLGPNFDVMNFRGVISEDFFRRYVKSYLMEGNAEAVVTTCEKANVLESSYFKFS